MQAILDACADGRLDASPCVVVSNNASSAALARARSAGLPALHISARTHPDPDALDQATLAAMRDHGVDHVILAGYMRLLGRLTTRAYAGRILNIHPALLPRFGGQGMYGERVHEAVLAAGDRVTGATVHLGDEEYDHGPIVAQAEVPVLPDDTVSTLAARVLVEEHRLFVETLQRVSSGAIDLDALWKRRAVVHAP